MIASQNLSALNWMTQNHGKSHFGLINAHFRFWNEAKYVDFTTLSSIGCAT